MKWRYLTLYLTGDILLEKDVSKLSARKVNFQFLLDLVGFMILSAARKFPDGIMYDRWLVST